MTRPEAAYRTDLPPDQDALNRASGFARHGSSWVPAASDNATGERVLLYGPRGETLIRQEPRRVGFRPRP